MPAAGAPIDACGNVRAGCGDFREYVCFPTNRVVLRAREWDLASRPGTRRPRHGEQLVGISYCVDAEQERVEEREGDSNDAEAERDRRDDRQRHERRLA